MISRYVNSCEIVLPLSRSSSENLIISNPAGNSFLGLKQILHFSFPICIIFLLLPKEHWNALNVLFS